jgi:hypothetical protein
MTRKTGNQVPEMITVSGGALTIMAPSPSNSAPASARSVKAIAKKLDKLFQEIIELAVPAMCRNYLPVVSAGIEELKDNPSRDDLRRLSSLAAMMRTEIITMRKNGSHGILPKRVADI